MSSCIAKEKHGFHWFNWFHWCFIFMTSHILNLCDHHGYWWGEVFQETITCSKTTIETTSLTWRFLLSLMLTLNMYHTFFYVSIGYYACWASSFLSSFLHGRWRLITKIPIFIKLYHSLCGFENSQKKPVVFVLQKKCCSKYWKIGRKSLVPESFLIKLGLQL